jgi:glycosyltransferase involved in cell wall biosynthesis
MSPVGQTRVEEERRLAAAQPGTTATQVVGAEADECEVSVVMPCLNEAATVETCVRKARRAFEELGVDGEVVVADNGSTDGSQELATAAGARVIHVAAPGYGSALMGGFAAARGRYLIMGDADDSYDFSAIGPFIEQLRAGYDLVMGNRFRGGIAPGAMPPLNRYLGNPVLSALGRLLFRTPARDFHCGLRGFSRDAYRRMGLRTTGMEFASEVVVKSALLKLRTTEVPTTLSPDGRDRPPHLRPWRDGWRHLRFLLLFRPRWLFFYPGVALMLLGVLGLIAIAPGPLVLGPVTLDVTTMLFAGAAVIIGFQAAVFGIFARLYAMTAGFLPEDPGLRRRVRFAKLETGLVAGALLIVAGLALAVGAVFLWSHHSFGRLDYQEVLRIAIPGMVMLTVGLQTVFCSLFVSFLLLKDVHGAR